MWYQKYDDRLLAPQAAYALSILCEKNKNLCNDSEIREILQSGSIFFGPSVIRLGLMRQNGLYGPKDVVKAEDSYQRANDPGDSYFLNDLMSQTTGQALSLPFSKPIVERMVEIYSGQPISRRFNESNGRLVDVEPYWHIYFADILPVLPWAAEQGIPHANFDLGIAYLRGWGVPKDVSTAIHYFSAAANSGFAPAQHAMGLLSPTESRSWFSKAAEQAFAPAEYDLALVDETGVGGSVDLVSAAAWYEKSARQGYAAAMAAMGRLLLDGKGISKNYAQAIDWLWKAQTPRAKYDLGRMYENGWGTHKDLKKAYFYYLWASPKISEAALWVTAHKDMSVEPGFELYAVEGPYDLKLKLMAKDGSLRPCQSYKDWYIIETERIQFSPKFNRPLSEIHSLSELRKDFELANLWIKFPEKMKPDGNRVPIASACEPNGIRRNITFTAFSNHRVTGYVTGVLDEIRYPKSNDPFGDRERADLKYRLDFDLPFSETPLNCVM